MKTAEGGCGEMKTKAIRAVLQNEAWKADSDGYFYAAVNGPVLVEARVELALLEIAIRSSLCAAEGGAMKAANHIEPEKIEVCVGVEMQDFPIGDYLNAINEVTCYFQEKRMVAEDSLVDALKLYANNVEGA